MASNDESTGMASVETETTCIGFWQEKKSSGKTERKSSFFIVKMC